MSKGQKDASENQQAKAHHKREEGEKGREGREEGKQRWAWGKSLERHKA